MNRFFCCTALASGLLFVAASSWATDFSGDALRRYGGLYSTDCTNPAAPRLRASTESLNVEVGNHRMTGTQVQISMAPFGMQQPKPGEQNCRPRGLPT